MLFRLHLHGDVSRLSLSLSLCECLWRVCVHECGLYTHTLVYIICNNKIKMRHNLFALLLAAISHHTHTYAHLCKYVSVSLALTSTIYGPQRPQAMLQLRFFSFYLLFLFYYKFSILFLFQLKCLEIKLCRLTVSTYIELIELSSISFAKLLCCL